MNKKKGLTLIIGIVCVLLVLLAAAVAIVLDLQSADPILDVFQTEPTGETQPTDNTQKPTDETSPSSPSDEQSTPPQDLPSSVVIPSEKDPQTGEDLGISFPCQIPGYNLTIEKMAPYSGMFVEDGSVQHFRIAGR